MTMTPSTTATTTTLSTSIIPSLKSSQLNVVNKMLALNTDPPASSTTTTPSTTTTTLRPNQWKILIYDKSCRSIISPLLSVSQLRSRGVTLHLLLHTDREHIPDVPAVYFIRPTKENIVRIAKDVSDSLYRSFYFNFVTRLDRSLMEEFAKLIVQSQGNVPPPRAPLQQQQQQQQPNLLGRIGGVHDQYLDYVCLERDLFTLNRKDSYVIYNGSGGTEEGMEGVMEGVAYGLFSVVATLGQVPVIRCPKGGAPEMVGRKLNKMISEHPTLIRNKTTSSSTSRPLLVILDRNSDLITPIQHSSTYQALIDDLLDHSANRVEFEAEADSTTPGKKKKKMSKKKFDLDADIDPFYSRHKFNPFPEAIESNGAELQDVTARTDQIKSQATTSDSNKNTTAAAAAPSMMMDPMGGDMTSDLSDAVDSLPALLEQKRQLEIHTSILQAVMNEVAARDVPQFFELESSLATGTLRNDASKAKKMVLDLVTDASKGNVDDKVRLIMVYGLSSAVPSSDLDEVTKKMQEAIEGKGVVASMKGKATIPISSSGVAGGTDGSGGGNASRGLLSNDDKIKLQRGMKAIEYIKRIRSMQIVPTLSEASQSPDTSNTTTYNKISDDILSNFMTRATNQATGLLAKATNSIGTILGKVHKHHTTRVVENLCERKPNSEDDEYLYLDPRIKRGEVDVEELKRSGMGRGGEVREVVAFVIGGGCYSEYQNLQQVVVDGRRSVCYGSTEIVDSTVFLDQLARLA